MQGKNLIHSLKVLIFLPKISIILNRNKSTIKVDILLLKVNDFILNFDDLNINGNYNDKKLFSPFFFTCVFVNKFCKIDDKQSCARDDRQFIPFIIISS